jgi:hypothetical protein
LTNPTPPDLLNRILVRISHPMFSLFGIAILTLLIGGYLATVSDFAAIVRAVLKEEVGPEAPARTTRVAGRVNFRGRPVGSGWLQFVPIDGTVGNLRSASLLQDGTFHVDRVPVGKVAVVLTLPDFEQRALQVGDKRFGRFLFEARQSGFIQRVIPDEREARLNLDLEVEQTLFERLRMKLQRTSFPRPEAQTDASSTGR